MSAIAIMPAIAIQLDVDPHAWHLVCSSVVRDDVCDESAYLRQWVLWILLVELDTLERVHRLAASEGTQVWVLLSCQRLVAQAEHRLVAERFTSGADTECEKNGVIAITTHALGIGDNAH